MNGAMLLQHAAGVIEHRERHLRAAGGELRAIAARWSLVLGHHRSRRRRWRCA